MEHVWIVQHLDDDNDAEPRHIVNHEDQAHGICQQMVGNRSYAKAGDGYLYGPGDGTTSVMMRKFQRELVLRIWPQIVLPVAD